jgi:transposase-like protein/predicted RNA-binding Zn-ribbon protein involved in translation (DUF1610 family)
MQQQEMTLNDFMDRFPDEESCREHLFNIKWSDGFECPKCGHDEYYKIESRNLYQCTNCGHQASVTAGTIFHKTRTPLRIWFWIIFLVSKDKRGVSALSLSKEFPISYPTAWSMLHKIRKAMGDRDGQYQLSDIIEIDEGYFGGASKDKKRGRGTEKSKVLVSVSVDNKGNPQFAKMKVIENLQKETIHSDIKNNIEEGSTVVTDGYRSYSGLEEAQLNHERTVIGDLDVTEVLQSVHTLISNVKSFIIGTYHGLKKKHLQSYLDEYLYRFNRRFWQQQMFDRLLTACLNTNTITYKELFLT